MLAGLAVLGSAVPSLATIQGQMYGWAVDSEFPVPCEGEAEEDEAAVRRTVIDPS
jgi:hypothetical protein